MSDWSQECCEDGATEDCCEPIVPDCNDLDHDCSETDECHKPSGVCVLEVSHCVSWGDPHIIQFDGSTFDNYESNDDFVFVSSGDIAIIEQHTDWGEASVNGGYYVMNTATDERILWQTCPTCEIGMDDSQVTMLDIRDNSPDYWPTHVSPPGVFHHRFSFTGSDLQLFVIVQAGLYIDLGASLPNHLIASSDGFCSGDQLGGEPPETPQCSTLDTCCAKFDTDEFRHIFNGCHVDASWGCCEDGAEADCCDFMVPSCAKGDFICSAGDVCDYSTGVCVPRDDGLKFEYCNIGVGPCRRPNGEAPPNYSAGVIREHACMVECDQHDKCLGISYLDYRDWCAMWFTETISYYIPGFVLQHEGTDDWTSDLPLTTTTGDAGWECFQKANSCPEEEPEPTFPPIDECAIRIDGRCVEDCEETMIDLTQELTQLAGEYSVAVQEADRCQTNLPILEQLRDMCMEADEEYTCVNDTTWVDRMGKDCTYYDNN
eukprot:UN06535